MPELPEVESVVRSLRDGCPSLIGARVRSVNLVWPGVVSSTSDCFDEELLEGCRFASIGRVGKFLLFGLKNSRGRSLCLAVHLRMTGRLFLVPEREAVERHTRLALMLDDGLALRFDDPRKFGRVWLIDDPSAVTGGMGPDALAVGFEEFASRLTRYRRQIKPLLLDQSFVAGIGNIYADESLYRAGIHPCTISADLAPDAVRRLHAAIATVLSEAVEAQGANIDGVFKAGSFVVSVYGREGASCRICGTAISKIRVGQRGTHFCGHCQNNCSTSTT
ncbi:MAG: DNA-formamidopyrimidine glycosylase [Desulfuromonadales bacterium]|nr:DNA-formamidopyrimidine glycosylase [Desulfuromonadales bacterium]